VADQRAPQPLLAIVASVVWGLAFFPGLVGAALSVMFFDAPGSMENPAAWINAGIVASFPLLCLIAIAGSWIAWPLQKRRLAASPSLGQFALAGLPLLPIAYVVIAMILETLGLLVSGQPMGLHSTVIKH
jgi:hypothetical protein